MIKKQKRTNKGGGFTLVELIVVVVILAIIIGVAISGIYGYVKKSRINTDLNNASAMQKALSTLQTDKEVNNILKDLPVGSSAEITWSDEQKIGSSGIKASQTGKKDATVDSKFNSQFIAKMGELLSNGLPSSKTGEQFKIAFERVSAEEIICHVSSGVAGESSGGSESGTGGSTGGSESGTGGGSSEPHEHSYTSEVTKAATCTEAGTKTFTCSCGDTYTEDIEATGHTYGSNGKCAICGQNLPAGLYNDAGVLTVSWDKLISDGTIHVTNGEVTTNYSSGSNSSSDALTGKLIIPENIKMLNVDAFACCANLTSVIIPDNGMTICSGAFWQCVALSKVVIPESIKFKQTTGSPSKTGWFEFCTSLTSVGPIGSGCDVEWGPTTMYTYTFGHCTGLTSVTIPSSVTTIKGDVFWQCTSLTSVTIPNSVTDIGMWAFQDCTSLTALTIPSSVTTIAANAFYNVPHIYYNGPATGAPWGAKVIN